MSNTVVVVGGGFGAIASALRCRSAGFDVTVVERLDRLGGRAQVFTRNGFKFDAGPTVITAPFLFEELFSLFDEKLEDYLTFKPLEVWYRYHFSDGTQLNYNGNKEEMEQQIRLRNNSDVEGYRKLLSHSEKIFDVGFTQLAGVSFHKLSTMIRQIPQLLRLRADRTVSQMIAHYITDENLRQAFSIHPLLVGGNPFSTTSIYTLIHYLEQKWGVHFCMGGTGKLVDELSALMKRHGINIRLGADVKKIVSTRKQVTNVELSNGETIPAASVICNADPPTVYRELLEVDGAPDRRKKIAIPERFTKYSMGLYVLFFGTRKTFPKIAHHTIWLGSRFKELLREIFDGAALPEDFSLYIHRPTATDETFAPPGCDSYYVLCPVPNLLASIDWDIQGELLKDRILTALDQTIMPGLMATVVDEFWMDPTDFKQQYRAMNGAGFSIAPIFRQSAWFRYHNVDPHISNLYFAGAGTHPGAGLPGVVSSAKVIEKLISKRNRRS